MLDYLAYHLAQRRVAELARGALPDSPVRFPEGVSHPAGPGASRSLGVAIGALLRGFAEHLNRCRRLAPSPRPTVAGAAPVDPASPRSPVPDRATEPRPMTDREVMGCRPALELADV